MTLSPHLRRTGASLAVAAVLLGWKGGDRFAYLAAPTVLVGGRGVVTRASRSDALPPA